MATETKTEPQVEKQPKAPPAKTEGTSAAGEAPAIKPKRKKKIRKNVTTGYIHIQSTFNNTIVTLTDEKGEVLGWSSAGKMGFKGSRKSTPFAAQVVAEDVMNIAQDIGLKRVAVLVNGPGSGRETALRSIARRNIRIVHIQDVTPLPHNGCRPPKRRRV